MSPPLPEYAAELRAAFPFRGYITSAEHRAITLGQLRRVVCFVRSSCGAWADCEPSGPAGHPGRGLPFPSVNLYHVNHWLIQPATLADACSFVELLTPDRQPPMWYVSHWWGECVATFMQCLAAHQEMRALKDDSAYWVCAYANRQHSVASDVADDPRESSFYRALQLAGGLLLVLDSSARAFTRIWCAFEQSVALGDASRDTPMLLDIATCAGSGAQVISDGIAAIDMRHVFPSKSKADREGRFPVEMFHTGLSICLEMAQASNEIDRVRILNCLAGRQLEQTPPLREHGSYTRANVKLRAIFAVAAWRLSVERGLVIKMQLPKVLAANRWMDAVTLDFTGCNRLDYLNVAALAEGLPAGLERCSLILRGCGHVGDGNCATLVAGLPGSLKHLSINLSQCARLGDAGVAALACALPGRLQSLSLMFWGCHLLGDPGVVSLASGMPGSLLDLHLNFHGCCELTERGVAAVARRLPARLQRLGLYFTSCDQVGDGGAAALARGLPFGVEELELRCEECGKLSDKGIAALAQRLLYDEVQLSLRLAGTSVSAEVRSLAADWVALRRWYQLEAVFVAAPAAAATEAAAPAEAAEDDAAPEDVADDMLSNLRPQCQQSCDDNITATSGLKLLSRLRRCYSAPF